MAILISIQFACGIILKLRLERSSDHQTVKFYVRPDFYLNFNQHSPLLLYLAGSNVENSSCTTCRNFAAEDTDLIHVDVDRISKVIDIKMIKLKMILFSFHFISKPVNAERRSLYLVVIVALLAASLSNESASFFQQVNNGIYPEM